MSSFATGSKPQASALDLITNPPRCNLTASSTVAIATGTWTVVTFTTEATDTDEMFDSGEPTRVEINTTGLYLVVAFAWWAANATGVRDIGLCKNSGGSFAGGTKLMQVNSGNAGASDPVTTQLITVQALTAGDYLELFRAQTSGGNLAPSNTWGGDPAGLYVQRLATS